MRDVGDSRCVIITCLTYRKEMCLAEVSILKTYFVFIIARKAVLLRLILSQERKMKFLKRRGASVTGGVRADASVPSHSLRKDKTYKITLSCIPTIHGQISGAANMANMVWRRKNAGGQYP